MGETNIVNSSGIILKWTLVAGSLFSFLGVGLGAFAAHELKQRLQPDLFSIFEVGVRYQMYHALALFAVAWAIDKYPQSTVYVAGYCFLGGIIIFSGSLYLLSITGIRWLGAITPIGGLLFLAGWLWFGWTIWRAG